MFNNQQSTINNQQSAISNQQPAISNQQSTTSNPTRDKIYIEISPFFLFLLNNFCLSFYFNHKSLVGTDIQDNKCSWLVVQALDRVSADERKVLEQNYGQWDDKKVANVKALYNKLDIESLFKAYEEDSYKKIQTELDKVSLMPRDVFELLLKKIYKRSK